MNLAPSDVLEALNRLLDDNRELFIPETQQVVRPHPDFMLFATQNPPGLYGGRKVLSRAFRNRFLELHFDDIPQDELAMILEKRCRIAPSYSVRIVDVYKALQGARQKSRIFDGKHGYVTLRDLFRWAERRAVGYLELAQDGYMILGEKIRKPEDRLAVVDALESVMKIKLNIDQMYEDKFETIRRTVLNDDHEQAARGNTDSEQQHQQPEIIRLLQNVVWTKTMKRLFVLVSKCVEHKEPALLVGETGCGKTTVCQVLAAYLKRKLHIINAHQHSETSDFLGSQRPVRGKDLIEQELQRGLVHFIEKWLPSSHPPPTFVQLSNNPSAFWESMGAIVTATTDAGDRARIEAHVNSLKRLHQRCQSLFEWHDGPLVHALRNGEMFLLDEISLADDSVLERLNSVLEPHRLLVLAEKASGDQVAEEIIGAEEFSFLATMNPGGDFGKKELSPALRNRFTEIWAPQVSSDDDLTVIINNKITLMNYNPQKSDELIKWNTAQRLIEFIDWFALELKKPRDTIISLRDILAWISFMTTPSVLENVEMTLSFIHGGCLVLVDGIGVNPLLGLSGLNASEIMSLRERCKSALILISGVVDESSLPSSSQLHTSFEQFGIHPFFISQGPQPPKPVKFAFTAPTTIKNCMRVLRSMQLKKPVLLEGSPGVGKTSLIANLAAISGRNLVRINLSDQTDLSDLFGSDLPVEDGEDQLSIASGTSDGNATQSKISSGPEFAWRDGPFLQAMKTGDWVLLDELNLASQQVLEGLNACLDHRGVVYIPELDREFECSPEFRVFAAQNPQNQGGGRKGLPKSFVNRFTQVYVVSLEESDLKFIISTLHPLLAQELVDNLTVFINRMHYDIMVKGKFGWLGGPWEFNLRDILRWVELIEDELSLTPVTQVPLTHGGGVAFLYLAASRFVEMIFAQRMRSQHDRNCVYELFKEIFESSFDHSTAASLYSFEIRPQYNISETQITIGKVSLSRVTDSGNSSSAAGELEFLQDTLPYLQTLMYCVKRNWMALITGPPASGKTSLVRYLSKITGNHLEEFAMNGGVDTVELLGGFEQADLTRRKEQLVYAIQAGIDLVCRRVVIQHIKNSSMVEAARTLQAELVTIKFLPPSDPSVPTLMEALCGKLFNAYTVLEIQVKSSDIFSSHQVGILFNRFRDLQTSGSHGKFEWIDGTLIRAMEAGHWVLIDNVNFCSPSVLDRLNPLLEPNGSLMVNERGLVDGQVKIVHPHPNFRLFLSMDPRHGEISRAMRNRSIELSMDGFSCASSENYLQGQEAIGLNQLRILSSVGLHGTFIPSAVYRIHQAVKSLTKCAFDQGVKLNASDFVSDRDVLQLARTIAEKMQRGESWSTLLQSCVRDVYLFYARAEALVIADDNVSRKLAPNTKVAFDVIIREVEEIMGSVQRTLEKKSSFIKDCSLATLWPLKLTGELWCGDSRLASAVLIACTLDDCLMESPKRHSSAHYHLVSRCRNVFALTDESNWKMILIWLSHRLTRSSDLSVVCFESITLLLNSIVLEFGSENAGMRGSLWSSLLQKVFIESRGF